MTCGTINGMSEPILGRSPVSGSDISFIFSKDSINYEGYFEYTLRRNCIESSHSITFYGGPLGHPSMDILKMKRYFS